MTGEITLRGSVLPIGGLTEKVGGGPAFRREDADRAGRRTGRISRKFPSEIRQGLDIVIVEHMDEVLRVALLLPKPEEFLAEPSVPVDWRQPVERRERTDRRDDPSRMPVASAVPPPSAREDGPESPHSDEPASREPPSSSPDTNALPFPGPVPGLSEH